MWHSSMGPCEAREKSPEDWGCKTAKMYLEKVIEKLVWAHLRNLIYLNSPNKWDFIARHRFSRDISRKYQRSQKWQELVTFQKCSQANCNPLCHFISAKCDIFKHCQRICFLNVSKFLGNIKTARCMTRTKIPQMSAIENLSSKKPEKFQSGIYY